MFHGSGKGILVMIHNQRLRTILRAPKRFPLRPRAGLGTGQSLDPYPWHLARTLATQSQMGRLGRACRTTFCGAVELGEKELVERTRRVRRVRLSCASSHKKSSITWTAAGDATLRKSSRARRASGLSPPTATQHCAERMRLILVDEANERMGVRNA
jgi:hypothetical protein